MSLGDLKKLGLNIVYNPCGRVLTYQNSTTAFELSKSDRDVQEHDHIADKNGDDVGVTFAIQFILNSTLGREADGEVSIRAVLNIFFHVI